MENMIVIIGVIAIAFYIKYYIDKQKDTANLFVKKAENSQEKRPLSRETLRNINENRELKNDNKSNIFKDDLLIVRVVGVTNKNIDNRNRQDILKECLEGEQLVLIKEIDNKFSRYAIKVCRLNGEQLGYLEDKLSQKIHFRDMSIATVYINEIIGGTEDKPNLGCLIEIQFS